MEIKVVSLDFAGVIAPKDFIDYFWFVAIPKRIARFERITLYSAMKYVEEAYEKVSRDRLEWYLPEFWVKQFAIEHTLEDALRESIEVAEVYGDALEVVPILSTRYTMIIATNTIEYMVRLYLEKFSIIGKYVKRVYSCIDLVKSPRKNEEFYKAIVKDLGVSPSEVLHVGDDPIYDGEIPRKLGINSVVIDRGCKHSMCIKDLYEVVDLLGMRLRD